MTKSNEQVAADRQKDWRTDPEAFAERVGPAIAEATKQAIKDHHRAGNPVAIWHEGQVVLWYPDGTLRPVAEDAA